MRKSNMLPAVFIAAIGLASLPACKKETKGLSFEGRIPGDWKVVGTNGFIGYDGVVAEWGLYYVGAMGLKSDHTISINGGVYSGTWKLSDEQDKITFYTELAYVGPILRDTTTFRIYFDDADRLVLEDDTNYLIHKRK